jgi:hypothetical protein
MEEITVAEIAQNYKAMLDSVNLLKAGKPTEMSDEEWIDCQSRNIEHLKIMVAKDYWTDEDMSEVLAIIGE